MHLFDLQKQFLVLGCGGLCGSLCGGIVAVYVSVGVAFPDVEDFVPYHAAERSRHDCAIVVIAVLVGCT
jgi:hypothetical protein